MINLYMSKKQGTFSPRYSQNESLRTVLLDEKSPSPQLMFVIFTSEMMEKK